MYDFEDFIDTAVSRKVVRGTESAYRYVSARGNYAAYNEAASIVLSSVVELLRLCGHLTARLRRSLCPMERRVGLEYGSAQAVSPSDLSAQLRRYANGLKPILEHDPHRLDGHFARSAEPTGVTGAHWYALQREMLLWLHQVAPVAVTALWGILPGEPDSFQRAGPRCMPNHCGLVVPARFFSSAPSPSDPPASRPGTDSLSQLYEQVQASRSASPSIPEPPSAQRDMFVWTDWHHHDHEAVHGSSPPDT